jgi:acyl-CoA thioester hydrolase
MTADHSSFVPWLSSCRPGLDGEIVRLDGHSEHHYPLIIQYEDTDAGGITYHSSYINFAERARSAWLRLAGFSLSGWLADHNQGFVIRKLETDYKTPSKLHERMAVCTSVLAYRRASCILSQNIYHENGHISARVIVHGAWVDITSGPKAFPPRLSEIIALFHQQQVSRG